MVGPILPCIPDSGMPSEACASLVPRASPRAISIRFVKPSSDLALRESCVVGRMRGV